MEIITHILLGAIISGVILSRFIGNWAFVWGGIIALCPHIDLAIAAQSPSFKAIYIERGFTHSLLFIFLITPLVSLTFYYIYRFFAKRRNPTVSPFTLAQSTKGVLAILASHVMYDLFTIDGAALFSPFSAKRYALCSIADFDVFFVLPLAIIVLLALILSSKRHKTVVSYLGIFIALLYVSFTFLNKLYVQSEFEKKLLQEHVRFSRTEIFPVVGSNFVWNCIAQDRDGFWTTYETNFSKHNFELNLYIRNEFYIFDFENDDRIKKINDYTKGFFIVQKMNNGDIFIRDLRKGKRGLKSDAEFANSFRIKNNHGIIQTIDKQELSTLAIIFSNL